SDVPPAVADVVHKLLAKQPGDRYPSARALIEALDATKRPRRSRRGPVAAALLLAVFAFGFIYALSHGSPTIVLERLELGVFPENADPDGWELLKDGKEQALVRPIPSLRPATSFKLHGQFRRPTYWYLLWFDTAGEVAVAARAPDRQTELE